MFKIKKKLHKYINGNTKVTLFSDGTKIRYTEDDKFHPIFPESIDLKITNYCDMNCPMCHEESTTKGLHGDLKMPFLCELRAGTEIAIGGGNPLSHPQLIPFLKQMKKQKVVCNMTVNQKHLFSNINMIEDLINNEMIYGLGLSLSQVDEDVISFIKRYSNSVIHLILGVHNYDFIQQLKGFGAKILLLGYKQFGRGKKYFSPIIEQNIEIINEHIIEMFDWFKVLSFDNLALEQLSLKDKVSPKMWNRYFQGNDGDFTMYIDLVENKYAASSTSIARFKIQDDIEIMFNSLQKEKTK